MKSDWNNIDFNKEFGELLCRELAADGISVSDDLVARTLAAVQRDEADTEKQLEEKKQKRIHKIRVWTFSLGTVAAACLILVLGISVIQRGLRMGKDSAADGMAGGMNFAPKALENAESATGSETTGAQKADEQDKAAVPEPNATQAPAMENPASDKEMKADFDSDNGLSDENVMLGSNGMADESMMSDDWFSNSNQDNSLMVMAASNIRKIEDLTYATNMILYPEEVSGEENSTNTDMEDQKVLMSEISPVVELSGILEKNTGETPEVSITISDEEVQYRILCQNEDETIVYYRIMQGGEYFEQFRIDEDGNPYEGRIYHSMNNEEILVRLEELLKQTLISVY